ncbi:hypothetical protein LTR53_001414 [Teratosphaeriaceae sp. CCFEE 6253]|nr:hypothetical protein LTR53_001414 [Teratosphaeriaceae sp. CCFEE 6253]
MQYTLASLALAALAAAKPMPQGVTSAISPSGTPPADCSSSYSGSFSIQTVNVTTSSKVKRQADDTLVMTLSDGILKDAKGRTGYIAANSQFQFDGPPQTGAIYTAGWSVCSNGSLTIGDDSLFYSCLSGTFYNLYEDNPLNANQCFEVYINAIGGASSSGVASQTADGQVTGAPTVASQLSDGQPQATTPASSAAIQAPTSTAAPVVSAISDGQIQAPTSTAAPLVSAISDGQIQAPTSTAAPLVSAISDGQIQAPTSTGGALVSAISDGQIQAPTQTPVTQIGDGQIQAPAASGGASATANGTFSSPTASVVPYTGGASAASIGSGVFALAAGVLAVIVL